MFTARTLLLMVVLSLYLLFFFFSSRRRHTRWTGDWSSDVCSSDLIRSMTGCSRPESCDPDRYLAARSETGLSAQERMVTAAGSERICERRNCAATRSEERRVGKECRARWATYD